ncbi:tRNA pseudouridine(55) synthase TruB [Acidobacteria bacterium AH-259-D05]|nr:tRNA pseudouridine(55) synthase TruB [Acidobacteria bacterium AH-259-D05]
MTNHEPPCGALVVDKPCGPTSQDIVSSVRALLKTKIGHTGTLDPMATGVLPLVLGRATRLARFFQASDKEYLAEIKLGCITDTFDREGKVLQEKSVPEISSQQAKAVLAKFTGEIRQHPPMFSAVKVGGQKLYNLARQNLTVERPWRIISIFNLELLQQTREAWSLRVHCSSGTYIRALAHEIGQELGCGAYLCDLRRLRSGGFDLTRAVGIEEIETRWREVFYPMEHLLPEIPRIELDELQAKRVSHGNEIPCGDSHPRELYRLFHHQKLVAIGQPSPVNQLRPIIVLRTADETKH